MHSKQEEQEDNDLKKVFNYKETFTAEDDKNKARCRKTNKIKKSITESTQRYE